MVSKGVLKGLEKGTISVCRPSSVSLNASFPVMAGKKWDLRVSSRDWKKEQSVFVVRIRYFHLLESQCVKAKYEACG